FLLLRSQLLHSPAALHRGRRRERDRDRPRDGPLQRGGHSLPAARRAPGRCTRPSAVHAAGHRPRHRRGASRGPRAVHPDARGRAGGPLPLAGSLWERGGLDELRHRHMAVTLFFGLGAGTIFVFLPTFADSLGVETLSLFYTAFAVSAIGVRVFGGRLIDTHGRRAVIVP